MFSSCVAQKLVSSFERTLDDNIIMKCNFENFEEDNQIDFCRFARVSDNYGVNLVDGTGNQKYRYVNQNYYFKL